MEACGNAVKECFVEEEKLTTSMPKQESQRRIQMGFFWRRCDLGDCVDVQDGYCGMLDGEVLFMIVSLSNVSLISVVIDRQSLLY